MPAAARSRMNGCTVDLSCVLMSPDVSAAHNLCIDNLLRDVGPAYYPYSPYAVLAPCRPNRHMEICRAWLGVLTPPSSLSSKRLAAGGIYLTLQPRADTYRTSSYKPRCDTLRAGALQRRAVFRGEYVNEFATGVGHIGRVEEPARTSQLTDPQPLARIIRPT